MDYFGYIFGSYAVTGLVFAALIAWVLIDGRARRRDLAELEAMGVRRRSDRSQTPGGQQ